MGGLKHGDGLQVYSDCSTYEARNAPARAGQTRLARTRVFPAARRAYADTRADPAVTLPATPTVPSSRASGGTD